ncbi:MAG: TonB-dependent receptor [Saprospiraceae bacterium]|nr:TonB-dependent receptor [Saprospiraceae bacterium]
MSDSLFLLSEITVEASRIDVPVLTTARAVSFIQMDSLAAPRELSSPADILDRVPGIFNLNAYNFAQDLRVSLRGFGSRAAFGVRGLKILVDGVPISTPDGQSQFDHLDPATIGAVEVIRGAASSLYGNAAGGMINFKSVPLLDGGQIGFQAGSYGMFRSLVRYGTHWGANAIEGRFSSMSLNGYRAHSEVQNYQGEIRFRRFIEDGQLNAQLNYTNSPQAQDPGGVNLSTAEEDPRAARQRNVDFDSGEELSQVIGSFVLDKQLSPGYGLKGSLFYTRRAFSNRLPFENGGQVDLDRNFVGSTIQLQHKGQTNWTIGLDLEGQSDERLRYLNLEGQRGAKTLDQQEKFTNGGLFFVVNKSIGTRFNLDVSNRLDRIAIDVEDRFLSDGDDAGSIHYWHASPSLGISYRWLPTHSVFASYSHSFESPTLSAFSANPNGEGGFNPDLDPVIADQLELGFRGGETFSYALSLFTIDLSNDLLPFELEAFPGRTFFRNSGKGRRNGLELATAYTAKSLQASLSYTWSNFTVQDGGDLKGNRTPAIPEHRLVLTIDADLKVMQLGVDFRHQSLMYADDENSVEVPAVALIDLSARKSWSIGEVQLVVFGGLRNVTDRDYFSNIRINAFGSRYYEAGPKINGYLGARLEF